jgi:uncharacterized Zn finger protein
MHMISCPSCGGGEQVQIRTLHHDTMPEWAASCDACGTDWELAD